MNHMKSLGGKADFVVKNLTRTTRHSIFAHDFLRNQTISRDVFVLLRKNIFCLYIKNAFISTYYFHFLFCLFLFIVIFAEVLASQLRFSKPKIISYFFLLKIYKFSLLIIIHII
jgi:hypothetical protein